MYVSLRLLNSFIDVEEFFQKPHELASRLTFSGTEVEGFEDLSKKYEHLLIGEVIQKQAHPHADRLNLCLVKTKAPPDLSPPLSIVCGADNFQTGDLVVVAPVGTKLPGGIHLKARKIRGETSQGMILSLSELGLPPAGPTEKSGILVLPPLPGALPPQGGELQRRGSSASKNPQPKKHPSPVQGILPLSSPRVGQSFAQFVGWDDIVFKLVITPNRGDLLSHFGLARELSALLNKKLKIPGQGGEALPPLHEEGKQTPLKLASSDPSPLSVHIACPDQCDRYTGRAVYGVTLAPSPLELRCRLQALGVKSINNVVDATNYTLLVWGGPLHAFDRDLLSGSRVTIDQAKKGEKLKTLDGKTLAFEGGELIIRDSSKPVALAGVIGGQDSSVQAETKNIFLESACFNPVSVRRSAKKFHIETDSSYRFARKVPPEMALFTLHQGLHLIQATAGGGVSPREFDLWSPAPPSKTTGEATPSRPQKPKPLSLHKNQIQNRMGGEVSFSDFTEKMRSLGVRKVCSTPPEKEKGAFLAPFFRPDLRVKEDLIEEYARVTGYAHIPSHHPGLPPQVSRPEYFLELKAAQALTDAGFYQAINHSFVSDTYFKEFMDSIEFLKPSGPDLKEVFVQNPLSREYNMMRTSLLPSLFKNAEKNIHNGTLQGRLFETGEVFYKNPSSEKHPYQEEKRIALIAWGEKQSLWHSSQNQNSVYELKAALAYMLKPFLAEEGDLKWLPLPPEESPAFMHPHQCLFLKLRGRGIGYMGSLHPLYARKYKIRTSLSLAEINTSMVFSDRRETKPTFKNLSPFPQVQRDMSFVVPGDVKAGDLLEDMKKHSAPLCHQVIIFDLYQGGAELRPGERAIAFRFLLKSPSKTLTEKDLSRWQNHLMQKILKKWQVKLRSSL